MKQPTKTEEVAYYRWDSRRFNYYCFFPDWLKRIPFSWKLYPILWPIVNMFQTPQEMPELNIYWDNEAPTITLKRMFEEAE